MNVETSLADYYAKRAAEYERIYQKPERQDDLRWLREFVARTFAGKRVFEPACGTGYWTEILSRVAASVLAADVNEEVLAIARSKQLDDRRVTFVKADAYALPVFAEQFAAGLAVFWWSHVPKARLREFLRIYHRAFARGATVVFIDNVFVDGSSTPVTGKDGDGNTYQERRLDDGSTHEVLKNFPTESELRCAVDGLAAEVEIKLLRYYWTLSYVPKVDK